MSNIHFFGIRHHGMGSAHRLTKALRHIEPDCILIEGPPEATHLIQYVNTIKGISPPAAVLVYQADRPENAAHYPMANFSPEYHAMLNNRFVTTRFFDLPHTHTLAMMDMVMDYLAQDNPPTQGLLPDPLTRLAQAAGFESGEAWWDARIENRIKEEETLEVFQAIHEAMIALREDHAGDDHPITMLREAAMRIQLAETIAKGFQRIAVVCGAWHTPALQDLSKLEADRQLIANLPRVEVIATWVPWTYERLATDSGYGAGVRAPMWSETRLEELSRRERPGSRWLPLSAAAFRQQGYPITASHVLDAQIYVEALAAVRRNNMPTLDDMLDAVATVFFGGDPSPIEKVAKEVLIGEEVGRIPDDVPRVPLHQDFLNECRRLRLDMFNQNIIHLDLRKDFHREKSRFLYRLRLLGIKTPQLISDNPDTDAYFHEVWKIRWHPEDINTLIYQSIYGTTVERAVTAGLIHTLEQQYDLTWLIGVLRKSLSADLPAVVEALIKRIDLLTTRWADVLHLMQTLPELINLWAYGSVHQYNQNSLRQVVEGIGTRIIIGLPLACKTQEDAFAQQLADAMTHMQGALQTLHPSNLLDEWFAGLPAIAEHPKSHPRLSGKTYRLLYDSQKLSPQQTHDALHHATNRRQKPVAIADWLGGFLSDGGLVLMHDHRLLDLINTWVMDLSQSDFDHILPLLRRIFARFANHERQHIQYQLQSLTAKDDPKRQTPPPKPDPALDHTLSTVSQLLGLTFPPPAKPAEPNPDDES